MNHAERPPTWCKESVRQSLAAISMATDCGCSTCQTALPLLLGALKEYFDGHLNNWTEQTKARDWLKLDTWTGLVVRHAAAQTSPAETATPVLEETQSVN